jgi:uncharacterized protein
MSTDYGPARINVEASFFAAPATDQMGTNPMPDRPRSTLAEQLDLAPHPEGGWYRETWRSHVSVEPAGYPGPRAVATAIYFLLHPGEESRWHVVRSDELWLWHSGGPLALRFGGWGPQPGPDTDERTLGPDVASGQHPQLLVPGGVWQAAAPAAGEPVLVSCVVAPGFDMEDFRDFASGSG